MWLRRSLFGTIHFNPREKSDRDDQDTGDERAGSSGDPDGGTGARELCDLVLGPHRQRLGQLHGVLRAGRVRLMRALLAAVLGAIALAVAAPAHADSSSFIDYLQRNGIDTSGEAHDADIDLGYAICDMYSAGGTNADVTSSLSRRHSPAEVTVWEVASVGYLCPQNRYAGPGE
ncbi:MAG: hypothetical protein QOC62_4496 [Mycobacterium sp.]|nr:hypothetical protein [Mycobacterium sp.]